MINIDYRMEKLKMFYNVVNNNKKNKDEDEENESLFDELFNNLSEQEETNDEKITDDNKEESQSVNKASATQSTIFTNPDGEKILMLQTAFGATRYVKLTDGNFVLDENIISSENEENKDESVAQNFMDIDII